MRRRTGRGELGELGEKRNWRFCLAERRAELEFIFALVSVEVSTTAVEVVGPLDGDIWDVVVVGR